MSPTSSSSETNRLFQCHMNLLGRNHSEQGFQEVISTPIFTMPIVDHIQTLVSGEAQDPFPQYGLLAGVTEALRAETIGGDYDSPVAVDPRIFFNVAAPSSIFICGSQGSGKSHTLSCLLESCLIPTDAGKLTNPLTGLVFHYDTFISDDGGSPCEAAFLSSDPKVKVRVLCSPTNLRTIQRTYHSLDVEIEPLSIDQVDLNTKRMLDLMAVNQDEGPLPLYLHTVYRILRELRMQQQQSAGTFDYDDFKAQILSAGLSPAQLGPLNQRLDTLESFMPSPSHITSKKHGKKVRRTKGTDWESKPGHLTIIDLSCPCVTPESACSLFNICLSLFLEQDTSIGRVIALDEAHKFMDTSAEAQTFTNTLLSTIRLQRHLGARVIISTQEPTISPALLDLSSVTIVHRFTSPKWLQTLRAHLAAGAIDTLSQKLDAMKDSVGNKYSKYESNAQGDLIDEIVGLQVGQALLFAPSAVVDLGTRDDNTLAFEPLGARWVKINIRARLTLDGGKSVMAG